MGQRYPTFGRFGYKFSVAPDVVRSACGRSGNVQSSAVDSAYSREFPVQSSSVIGRMVQSEQELSHAANPTPIRRRNHPRVNHACQRCRTKKAKCDQQRPCLTCVKHTADCEYGIRKRSGRKKQLAYQSNAETPGARLTPGFSTRSNIRSDESELREHPHDTALSGTHSNIDASRN